jgi:hypothetical protein
MPDPKMVTASPGETAPELWLALFTIVSGVGGKTAGGVMTPAGIYSRTRLLPVSAK